MIIERCFFMELCSYRKYVFSVCIHCAIKLLTRSPPPPPPPALTSRPAPLLRASFRFPHKSLLIGRLYPLVFILSPPIPSPCIHKSCPRHLFGFLHKRLGLFPAPQAPRPCLARMPSVDPIILLYESYSPDLEESSSPRHNDLG